MFFCVCFFPCQPCILMSDLMYCFVCELSSSFFVFPVILVDLQHSEHITETHLYSCYRQEEISTILLWLLVVEQFTFVTQVFLGFIY